MGSKFIIHNDQKPLCKVFAHNAKVPTTCSARLQRWYLKLSLFDYEFVYSKGAENVNSDCFSRLPLPDTVKTNEPYELIFALDSINDLPITCKEIEKHTSLDRDLKELKSYIQFGFPYKLTNPNLTQYKHVMNQMTLMKGCIIFNDRVLIPNDLRIPVLQQFHEGHPGICAMKAAARSLIWYPNMDKDIELLVKSCDICKSVLAKPPQTRNCLLYTSPSPRDKRQSRMPSSA